MRSNHAPEIECRALTCPMQFCITNGLCALIFFFTYPETRGKSLEEISEIFGDVKVIREVDATGKGLATPNSEKASDAAFETAPQVQRI